MSHVMLDLETLGTEQGSVILSIGAVVFDPRGTGHTAEFYQNVDVFSSLMAGLKISDSTVNWWKEQNKEAQKHLIGDTVSLFDALNAFRQWFMDNDGEQVWCQGATFDAPLLQAAYKTFGDFQPWKFWNVRDTRTVYDVCGFDYSTLIREGTYHNALDDAAYQVRCVQEALKHARS